MRLISVFPLPSLLVSAALLPFVINIISSYCYDRWKNPENDSVELQFFVESRGHPCVWFKYKGKVTELSERMLAEAARCLPIVPHREKNGHLLTEDDEPERSNGGPDK